MAAKRFRPLLWAAWANVAACLINLTMVVALPGVQVANAILAPVSGALALGCLWVRRELFKLEADHGQ